MLGLGFVVQVQHSSADLSVLRTRFVTTTEHSKNHKVLQESSS